MNMVKRGSFISFEGGDGVGKSTQIELLAAFLRNKGLEVVVTREPGGSSGAEAIRELLVNGAADRWSARTEAMMMYASRNDHLENLINPARARGAIVLCDRFADSTMAYQGIAGDLGVSAVETLYNFVVGDNGPELTFVLDMPEDIALHRATERANTESRFEDKGEAYQARVRAAFLEIARLNPERCVLIDASEEKAIIAQRISAVVEERGVLSPRP